jgi:hypothetical protein
MMIAMFEKHGTSMWERNLLRDNFATESRNKLRSYADADP